MQLIRDLHQPVDVQRLDAGDGKIDAPPAAQADIAANSIIGRATNAACLGEARAKKLRVRHPEYIGLKRQRLKRPQAAGDVLDGVAVPCPNAIGP